MSAALAQSGRKQEAPWGTFMSTWTIRGEQKAGPADNTAAITWVFATTFLNLGALVAPLRYGAAIFFLVGLVMYWRVLLPLVMKNFAFFVIPILAVISALWSPSAADSIRWAVLMALTSVVAIFIGGRLHPKQIIRAYFYITFVASLCSCIWLNDQWGPAIGIFPQKNVLAINCFFQFVAALTIALDKEEKPWLRLICLGSLPIAITLIVLAQSGTIVAFSVIVTAAFIGQVFVWGPAAKIPHLRTFIVFVFGAIGAVASIIMFGLIEVDLWSMILESLGKDSSLTGRTYLWDIGRKIIAEHPLTGVGAAGYWHEWRGEANSITKYFHFKTFTVFNFHNSYIELGVHLGYPGMIAGYCVTGWALIASVRRWVLDQSLQNFFFLVMVLMVASRSNTEMDLAGEFGGTLVLLYIGAIVPVKRKLHPSLTAPADPQPAPAPAPQPPLRPAYGVR